MVYCHTALPDNGLATLARHNSKRPHYQSPLQISRYRGIAVSATTLSAVGRLPQSPLLHRLSRNPATRLSYSPEPIQNSPSANHLAVHQSHNQRIRRIFAGNSLSVLFPLSLLSNHMPLSYRPQLLYCGMPACSCNL